MIEKRAGNGRWRIAMRVVAGLGGSALLLSACAGAPASGPAAAGSTTAPTAGAVPTQGTPQADWAGTICAQPEIAALRKATKGDVPTSRYVGFGGGNKYGPAMEYCSVQEWTIGVTMLPFDRKKFKAMVDREKASSAFKSAKIGDGAFTLYGGARGFAQTGDVLVSASLGPTLDRRDQKALTALLKVAVAEVARAARPSLTAGDGLCSAGSATATEALGVEPMIRRGRLFNNALTCLWGTGTKSVTAGTFKSSDYVSAEEAGFKEVTGLGFKAGWVGWSDTLKVQLAADRAAYVSVGTAGKDAAVAVFKAMEPVFTGIAKAG